MCVHRTVQCMYSVHHFNRKLQYQFLEYILHKLALNSDVVDENAIISLSAESEPNNCLRVRELPSKMIGESYFSTVR
jgi:hypothetical protein